MHEGFAFLDIFAGAGGLSEGFVQAGFSPVAHVEMDSAACNTLKTRVAYHWLKGNGKLNVYYDYLAGKISRDNLYKSIPEEVLNSVIQATISKETREQIFQFIDNHLQGRHLDLIVGGPPCQAYSLVGRARDKNHMVGDKRNYLYMEYAEFLKQYKPEYFVFENVLGLLSAYDTDGIKHFDKMSDCFRNCGYSVECRKLNAKSFGVLQNRRRIILVGKRGLNQKDFYPEIRELSTQGSTVNDVLSDLPKISSGQGCFGLQPVEESRENSYLVKSGIKQTGMQSVTLHTARPNNRRDLEIYRQVVQLWNEKEKRLKYNDLDESLQTHKNKSVFTDRYKVVAGNLQYSQTIVAHIAKDGHYYIHPDISQNRSLSPREVARIQTFPDDYFFESESGKPSRTSAYKQIGNAVPVLLARKVAEAMKLLMQEI